LQLAFIHARFLQTSSGFQQNLFIFLGCPLSRISCAKAGKSKWEQALKSLIILLRIHLLFLFIFQKYFSAVMLLGNKEKSGGKK
jgi:hypothetical protein